jgi:hypothetical protein
VNDGPLSTEPALIVSAANAAIVSTIGVVAYVQEWAPDLVAIVNTAAGAWIILAGLLIRSKVTPTAKLPAPPIAPQGLPGAP